MSTRDERTTERPEGIVCVDVPTDRLIALILCDNKHTINHVFFAQFIPEAKPVFAIKQLFS